MSNLYPTTNIIEPVIGFMPYDDAIREYLTVYLYPDPTVKDIKVLVVPVGGPPRREYGTQEALNPATEKDPTLRQDQTIKLPASSISRLNWTFDPSRFTKMMLRHLGLTEDGNKIVQSQFPMPFNIMYQFDMWTKYRVEMNQFLRTITLKFINREKWLKVNLGGAFGVCSVPLKFYNGPSDLTELDPGDTDRTIRTTIELILEAWVIPDPFMIPTVRSIVTELYLGKQAAPYPTAPPPYTDWEYIKEIKTTVIGTDDVDENP